MSIWASACSGCGRDFQEDARHQLEQFDEPESWQWDLLPLPRVTYSLGGHPQAKFCWPCEDVWVHGRMESDVE